MDRYLEANRANGVGGMLEQRRDVLCAGVVAECSDEEIVAFAATREDYEQTVQPALRIRSRKASRSSVEFGSCAATPRR